MTAWWNGLPPAEARVHCQDATHRLRFADGRLRALDHDDIDAERTLAALGGEGCTCAEIVDAWTRHATNPRVLVAASRGPSDPLAGDDEPTMRTPRTALRRVKGSITQRGWTSYGQIRTTSHPGAPQQPNQSEEDELRTLLRLGGGLPARLVAGALHHLANERPSDARIHAAAYGCACAALVDWLGQPDRPVDVRITASDAERTIYETDEGTVLLEIPIAWVTEIWASGLATVAGCFCLGRSTTPAGSVLTVIAPDLRSIGELELSEFT
jgi:hypothetical protein